MPSSSSISVFWAAALLACLSFGGAPRGAQADESAKSGTQRLHYNENGYAILDPARYSAARLNDERVLIALIEPLTTLDPETGKVAPGAASSWTQGEDGVTWTFKLRTTARWSDGALLVAEDFVRSWKRTLDRSTNSKKASPWVSLLYDLQGCQEIIANAARTELFSLLRKELEISIEKHQATGIPGDSLSGLLTDLGVRPYLAGIGGRSLAKMLRWPNDETKFFAKESVDTVVKDLKTARKAAKKAFRTDQKKFGEAGSAVHAADDHTLVVRTEGVLPYLPQLMARGLFAPIHPNYKRDRDSLFDDANRFRTCGPFKLSGRGARPPTHAPNQPTNSVIDLVRDDKYDGPNKAKTKNIICYTDAWANSSSLKTADLEEFIAGKTHHVFATWRELPNSDRKNKKFDILPKYLSHEAWRVRPTGTALYLIFRCDRPPFNNKAARKVFSDVLDRSSLTTVVWPGAKELDRLAPPGVDGSLDGVRAPASDPAGAVRGMAKVDLGTTEWINLDYVEVPGLGHLADRMIKVWTKKLLKGEDLLGNSPLADTELVKALRGGKFDALLLPVRGNANDLLAYIGRFHSANPEGGAGWRDPVFDALIDAARNPIEAHKYRTKFFNKVKADAALRAALEAATSDATREAFRCAALKAAEQRLLDEYVVLPICMMQEAELGGVLKGFGSDTAWQNPGFVGALWHVTR